MVPLPEVQEEADVNLIKGLGWLLVGMVVGLLALHLGLLLMGGVAELVHDLIKR